MPKDVRKLLRDYEGTPIELSQNHQKKFTEKLEKEFPSQKKIRSKGWYVAASVVLLLGLGLQVVLKEDLSNSSNQPANEIQEISLGDVSPEMKKVEDYYLTAIHYEIASLEVTPQNKDLLDEYLEKIGKLDADYKRLSVKLQKEGISKETVDALIINLQLRLQLLIQLKDQVNVKQVKEEHYETVI